MDVVLVVEAGRREVGTWRAGTWPGHFGKRAGLWVGSVRRARVTAEGTVGVAGFLLPAL